MTKADISCIFLLFLLVQNSNQLDNGKKSIPDYEEFVTNIRKQDEQITKNYPSKNNVTGKFFPPQGNSIKDGKMTIKVNLWYKILRLKKMNIDEQSLQLVMREIIQWTDKSFDDSIEVPFITLPSDSLWTPDLYAYNIVGKSEKLYDSKTVECEASFGTCTIVKITEHTIPCITNVEHFPFDAQNCSLKIHQIANKDFRLVMQHQKTYMEEQVFEYEKENSGWKMESLDPLTYSDDHGNDLFELVIHLRRRATFYAIVLIYPCVLLNVLSLTIFTLSLKDTERETFAVTLILTYFVFIAMVVEYSPPSGTQTPLLGLYIILSTTVVVINFVMSVILIEIHEHFRAKNIPMPKWILRLTDNKFVITLFTRKHHFENQLSNDTDNGETVCLKQNRSNSIRQQNNQFQWKVLLKLLNFLFFLITFAAHIFIACGCFILLQSN